MNIVSKINIRPTLSTWFDRKPTQKPDLRPVGTLSKNDLRQIVAAMIG